MVLSFFLLKLQNYTWLGFVAEPHTIEFSVNLVFFIRQIRSNVAVNILATYLKRTT